MHISDCSVTSSHIHDIDKQFFDVDNSQDKYADVYLDNCKNCKRIWIWYMIEAEWHSNSGRWFLGEITQEQFETLSINSILELMESLSLVRYGGSFFNGTINESNGSILSLHARKNTPHK